MSEEMRVAIIPNRFTKEQAVQMVIAAGFEPLGDAWEDDITIVACSTKTIPGCYSHPSFTVQFHKKTGWLTATDQKDVNLYR